MFDALAKVWANPYARLVLIVIGLVLGYFFIRFTLRIWIIVLLAYLLAYLAHPVVSALERRRVPRPLGVLFILLGLLLFLGLASVLLEGVVVHLALLATDLPTLLAPLGERLGRALPQLERLPLPEGVQEVLSRAVTAPQTLLSSLAGTLTTEVASG